MLGYVTVGTNDLERAAAFYDAIAKEMGAVSYTHLTLPTKRIV